MLEKFPGFGGDEETAPDYAVEPSELETPLPPEAVIRAQQHVEANDILSDKDRNLVTLLNAVQTYIDNHEYMDQPGNGFYEDLLDAFNNPKSLRRPLKLTDDTLFVVILSEGYQAFREDLTLTSREINAIRDAHHIYADMEGLSEWTFQMNVLAIAVSETERTALIEESASIAEVADTDPAESDDSPMLEGEQV